MDFPFAFWSKLFIYTPCARVWSVSLCNLWWYSVCFNYWLLVVYTCTVGSTFKLSHTLYGHTATGLMRHCRSNTWCTALDNSTFVRGYLRARYVPEIPSVPCYSTCMSPRAASYSNTCRVSHSSSVACGFHTWFWVFLGNLTFARGYLHARGPWRIGWSWIM